MFKFTSSRRLLRVGIHFNDEHLSWVASRFLKGTYCIEQIYSVSLSSGVIVQGEIMDHEALQRVLYMSIKQANLTGVYAAIALPFYQIDCRPIQFASYLEPEDYETEIQLYREKYLPRMPADVVFDCYVERQEAEAHYGWIVAADRKLVNDYMEILKAAKLQPYVLELTIYSILRVIRQMIDLQASEIILIEADMHFFNLYIIQAGKIVTMQHGALPDALPETFSREIQYRLALHWMAQEIDESSLYMVGEINFLQQVRGFFKRFTGKNINILSFPSNIVLSKNMACEKAKDIFFKSPSCFGLAMRE